MKKSKIQHNHNSLFINVEPIKGLVDSHDEIIRSYEKGRNSVIYGYPGTGKTFMACSCAIASLMNNDIHSIRIIRSAVPSRDIGFLPGSEEEKMAQYERPYISMINDILQRDDGYGLLKSRRNLTFESSSFLRGVTYDNSFIIVDEFQNMSFQEINTIVTRVGDGSQIMICGDITQTDLSHKETGYSIAMLIMEESGLFDMIHMGVDDIVRSDFVKKWVETSEEIKKRLPRQFPNLIFS